MGVVRPDFVPDPSLSRSEMESRQTDIAAAATFADDLDLNPDPDVGDGRTIDTASGPPVAGVDQAFDSGGDGEPDEVVSAGVLSRGGRVLERAHARRPTAIPYVPGLLSFREGSAVLEALTRLAGEPAVTLVDGSGRIHFREAGLATHVGVTLDAPTVGVAKNLLCGRPREPIPAAGFPEGARVAIEADDDVSAPEGTVIGYAVQTRQYDSPKRHVNPVYVSPGHRTSAETAADVALACTAGYKLPEPVRLADRRAGELTGDADS
jgi:deoxyribonuclease V